MGSYTVRYERDEEGWWVASVKEVKGVHTQGRSIDAARKRVREALSLAVKGAKTAKLVDEIVVGADVRKAVKKVRALQARAAKEQEEAAAAARAVARRLVKELELSVRDASEVLGVSFQRVQQLVTD